MVDANGVAHSNMLNGDVTRHHGNRTAKAYVGVTRCVARLFVTCLFGIAEQDVIPAATSMIMNMLVCCAFSPEDMSNANVVVMDCECKIAV